MIVLGPAAQPDDQLISKKKEKEVYMRKIICIHLRRKEFPTVLRIRKNKIYTNFWCSCLLAPIFQKGLMAHHSFKTV